mgnify:CR=1 FL=1
MFAMLKDKEFLKKFFSVSFPVMLHAFILFIVNFNCFSLDYEAIKNKIIEIDLEDYVRGVIAGEMPISFDLEALKEAQAQVDADAIKAAAEAVNALKGGKR